MATPAGIALTSLHYRQQLAVRAHAVRDAVALWRMYTPGDRASWDRMMTLARPVVENRYRQSSVLADRYFEAMALLETGRHQSAAPPDPLPPEQIDASLAATGLVGVIRARAAGFSPQAAMQTGFVRFSGGLSRLALLGGRDAVVASVASSRLATGWTRVTSASPCEYCAEQAGVGATNSEVFPAHDHCACSVEPAFS